MNFTCGDELAIVPYVKHEIVAIAPTHDSPIIFLNETVAETTSVRVSFIQIMQIRVQNKSKTIWKSRYDGDVSTPPSLTHCLSSSNSVDKLKVIKKKIYKLCLLLLL